MTRRHTVIALLLVCEGVRVSGQIFGGVVFDPENYANALLRYDQLRQQFSELVATYNQIRAEYLLLVQQAQRLPVTMTARYRLLTAPWSLLAAPHRYDTTAAWIAAANTGENAAAAVAVATQPLGIYGDLSRLAPDEAARIRTRYDRLQLADATMAHSLQALGTLRGRQPSVEQVVRNLESDAFTDAADFNTQVALLNKINATTVTATRLAQDANNVLISLLEQQLIDTTARRDAAAESENAHIAFERQARSLLEQTTVHTTDALMTFRIP